MTINKIIEALNVAIGCIEDCEYASQKIGSNSRIDEAVNFWYDYAETNDIDKLLTELTKVCDREVSCAIDRPITPDEFTARMLEIREKHYNIGDDEEVCHILMDDLMTELLSKLGYQDGVAIFEDTPKWYA